MSTIQDKVLKAMSKQGIVARKDLCLIIFKAQGKKVTKTTKYKVGYYGTNIQSWVRDGLLERPEAGGYKLGKFGKRFLEDPVKTRLIIKLERAERSNRSLRASNDSLCYNLAIAERKIRNVRYSLND